VSAVDPERSAPPPPPPLRRALDDVRAATALARVRPAYSAGLRAAVATGTPLLLDHLLHTGGGTWMSLAGFNGALADKGGPYGTRAATLAALTLAGSAAAAIGAIVAEHPTVAIPATFVIAVACSLARAYGNAGASVGVAALNIYVISLGFPPASPADAVTRLGFVVAGGLWVIVVSLVLWPLRPYRPVRLAVAAAYRAIARYAEEIAARAREGVVLEPVRVRATLEVARVALASMRRGRPGESGRGERLLVLGETADQLFGYLFGLSDVVDSIPLEARHPQAQAALADAALGIARTARGLAAAIEAEDEPVAVAVGWNGSALRALLADPAPSPTDAEAAGHYEQAAALLDRMAQYAGVGAAVTAGLNAGSAPPALERAGEVEDPEPPLPWLGPIRAVLAPDSLVLRHALRVGIVTAAAVALTAALGLERGYWVTITAVIILQPYAGATSLRAMQRVLGTIVGGALTAVLAALFHDSAAILGLVFVFSAVSVALLPLNYAAFSVFLTPTFVLLAEANAGDWHLAGLRIVNTLLGGALALAGTWLLWPSWESERLPAYLSAMLEAMRRYLAEVVARFDDRSDAAGRALRAARRDVGLAILNAEESLQRLLGEHRGRPEDLTPAMTLVTYARRFTASIAALGLSRHSVDHVSSGDLVPFAAAVDAALEDLAAALSEDRPPRPLKDIPEPADPALSPLLRGRLTRLARQLKTLHDAVERHVTASRLANRGVKL
jgi:uncharacterized membrane protein YccC